MELGLTSFADAPPDQHGERLRNVVEEIVLADRLGLDVYGLGEHLRSDMAASAPAITLAAAAGRTTHIRLSPAVVVLSSADPVRTYQDFATLDLLSNGRAELLVGRGSFIESFPLFGFRLSDYDDLFAEKLDLLLRIRDDVSVTWSGQFRPPLDGQAVFPRAQQDPLPVWVAVGGTPASVVRAGRLGLPLALAIIGGDPARFKVFADLYRRTLEESGHDPETPLAVHAHGFVADDTEQAAATIWPSYQAMMTKLGRERGWPPMQRDQFDWMRGPEGSLVLGDPATVAAKIDRWREVLGITRFMLHHAGRVDHADSLASIELLGTEVATRING